MTEKKEESNAISRRKYLKYGAAGVVVLAAAAGGVYYYNASSAMPPTPTATSTEAPATTGVGVATTEAVTSIAPTTRSVTGQINLIAATGYPLADFYQMLSKQYAEKTGVAVNWVAPGYWNIHDKISVVLASGSKEFDIVHTWQAWTSEWASAGFLEDVTDRLDPNWKNDIEGLAWDSVTWNNKYWGYPHLGSIYTWYQRKDLLDAAGLQPPANWDDWVAAVGKLYKPGDHYGLVMTGQAPMIFVKYLIFLQAAGGTWTDESGKIAFDTPEGLDALEFMIKLYNLPGTDPGSQTYITGEKDKVFLGGKAAMMFEAYANTAIDAANPDRSQIVGKVSQSLIPGHKVKSASVSGSEGYGVVKDAPNLDLAIDFLEFINTYENQKAEFKYAGWLPSRHSLYSDPDLASDPVTGSVLRMIAEQGTYPHQRYADQYYEQCMTNVGSIFSLALLGHISPKDALADAAKQARSIRGE